MAIEKIGFNVTNINNISPPNISFPSTGKGILESIPTVANNLAGGFLGHILLGGLFILVYLILSDKSPLGEFRYSDLRAFTMTSGMVSLLGITLLEISFISNLYIVGISTTLFIIGNIILLITSK
jgi:hypothetical protein